MRTGRNESRARETARVLQGLLLTTDDDSLGAFRTRRTGNPDLPLEQLVHVRDLLDALGETIADNNAVRWKRLEAAWRIVCQEGDECKVARELDEELGPAASPAGRQPVALATLPSAPAPPPVAPASAAPAASPPPPVTPSFAAPAASPPPPVAPSFAAPASVPPLAVVALPRFGAPASSRAGSPWAQAPEPAPAATPAASVDATGALDLSLVDLSEPVLPFKGHAAPPPPVADTFPPRPNDALDCTALATTPVSDESMPRFVKEPPTLPELTVEQYASLCAECAMMPERVADARRRYQLADERVHRVLDCRWAQRLQKDAELDKRFQVLLAGYQDWIRRQHT